MQGLASPFHLLPASQMGYTKNPEVNYVPFLDWAGLQKAKAGPPHVPLSLSFFSQPFSILVSLHMGASYPMPSCPLAFFSYLPSL